MTPSSPRCAEASSARLLSMGTNGLSTKTHNPSRCLRSERSGLALRALSVRPASSASAAANSSSTAFFSLACATSNAGVWRSRESGVVMLQPRLVQPVDLRDPLDPSLAPAPEPHMAGRARSMKDLRWMGPTPLEDHLAVELAGQFLVGREAIADQNHGALRSNRTGASPPRRCARGRCGSRARPGSPRSTARPGSSAPSRDTPERAMIVSSAWRSDAVVLVREDRLGERLEQRHEALDAVGQGPRRDHQPHIGQPGREGQCSPALSPTGRVGGTMAVPRSRARAGASGTR